MSDVSSCSLFGPILFGLFGILLVLLCYAAFELIRILIAFRIMASRVERFSDFGWVLDWFKKKPS